MAAPDRAPRPDRQPEGLAHPIRRRAEGQAQAQQGQIAAFHFVQWEFPGRLGPPPGRYVERRYAGDEVRAVIVVGEGTAPRRRRGRRRESSETVPVTRITVIDPSPVGDDAFVSLRDAGVSEAALASLTRFMSGWRVAAADAFAADVDVTRALCVRVGYGTGEEVAEGRWTEARELPVPAPPEPKRRSRHRPVERLAALLAARDVALACEELALRARADLSLGREREAALQLDAALSAALAELAGWVSYGDVATRLDELTGHRERVAAAAAAAREGSLDAAAVEDVRTALARLEAALRARAIYAAESE